MILTVIEHHATVPLDRFDGWLREAGVTELRTVRAWAGDPVPTADAVGDGLVVLGGPSHAYDDAGCPWLPATRALLADAVSAGVPTLGICLGAQLLAVATGGAVVVAAPPGRESGVVDVHPRPEAAADPLLSALVADRPADHPASGSVLTAMPSMHADAVVDLPAGAVWLASSRLYPYQAFRVGEAAWGLQFHPEVSAEVFAAWAHRYADVEPEAAIASYAARAATVAEGGRALAHRFAAVVADRAADPRVAEAAALTR